MSPDREARRQSRLAVQSGIQHLLELMAAEENTLAIAGAVAMVRPQRPALRRCREESGYSLARIIERCDTLMEASLQAGVSYQTVRRYARRWWEMSNNEWTQTELATMRERWPLGGAKACIGYVKRHRTLEAIKRKGNLIGLTSADILPEYRNTRARAAWSDEDDKRLSELYPKLGTDGCLEHFPGRSRPAIRNRVTVLGLRLLPQTLERMKVRRFGMEMTLAPKRDKQDDSVSQLLRMRW